MKKATLLIALAAVSVASAFGQGMMKKDHMMAGKPMMKKGMMHKMHSSSMMMQGLNKSEMKTAQHMMAMMSPAERSALMKMGMGQKMSKSEKMTAQMAMKKMTPAEKAVGMKMMKMHHAGTMKMHKAGMMKMKPMMKRG